MERVGHLVAGRVTEWAPESPSRVFDFIEVFYNRHPTLNYQAPVDYEQQRPSPAPAA